MTRPHWFRPTNRKGSPNRYALRRTLIAPSAVEAFLNRPRDDYNWVKGVDPKLLRERILSHWNTFLTPPRTAQLASFAIGVDLPRFLFNLDCGVGKTKLLMDLMRYHRHHNRALRWLVLVPNVINMQAWSDQFDVHGHDLSYGLLAGTREQRHNLVNERINVHILNYAGLQSFMTQASKGERVINPYAGDKFADIWDGVIADEIHNIGNKDTKTYWMVKRLAKNAEFFYGSTATLFGRDPTMMWTQFDLVDGGYTLGESLGLYRAAFFKEVEEWGRIEYQFDKRKEELLNRFIRHRSLRYTAAECGDIPKVSCIRERLSWTEEQLMYYDRIRNECRIAGIGKVKLNPSTYIRMRQICSGYVGYENDNGKAQLVFDKNPKLDRLLQIIKEMPWDTKLLVFHEYIFTGELIAEALEKRKIKFSRLYGGVKDAAAEYRKFIKDPECRVQIANYRMVAGGNQHEVCSYVYYFESPPDPITRKQSRERIDRIGQRKKVFIYDPCMPSSVDEDIQDALAEDVDFYERVCSGSAYVGGDRDGKGSAGLRPKHSQGKEAGHGLLLRDR